MDKADFYREARKDLSGPLAGVRVVDFTTSWAGPMCACILADLGAEVIKVEAPEGEVSRRLPPFLTGKPGEVSFANATVNRNKRNLTLDLGRPEGREIFLKLAASADVVVQNFRPGTVDKWGIGYADVRRVKPDIVYVSITGFGQFGPTHDRVCYDPLAQAAGGFVSLNGTVDGPPVKAATYLCDDLAGLHGASARWPRSVIATRPARASMWMSPCSTPCCSSPTATRRSQRWGSRSSDGQRVPDLGTEQCVRLPRRPGDGGCAVGHALETARSHPRPAGAG